MVLPRGAEEHRHDQVLLQILRQVRIDILLRRLGVLEQLLEQRVVEIGELLDQFGAGLRLVVPETVGQRDQVGSLTRLVAVGALADQIDIAGNLALAAAQRHLAQHQGPLGVGLQRRQDIAHPPGAGGVELVDKDHVRDVVAVEEAQQRANRDGAIDLGLADDDHDIGGKHRLLRLVDQLDIAGAVEDRPGIVEEFGVGDVEFGRHLPRPRLGDMVADRAAVAYAATAGNAAADKQQCFHQRGLARQIRADQGDTAVACGVGHRHLHSSRRGRYNPAARVIWAGWWRASGAKAIGIWKRGVRGPTGAPPRGSRPGRQCGFCRPRGELECRAAPLPREP